MGRDRLAEDVERVEAVRELAGPDVTLMADANMRWSVEEAIRACRTLGGYDLFRVEEPTIGLRVPAHDRAGRRVVPGAGSGEHGRSHGVDLIWEALEPYRVAPGR